jgi:hypothetical protein
MKSQRGVTDANNVWPAFSGAHSKRFNMGRKHLSTRDITTPKSF